MKKYLLFLGFQASVLLSMAQLSGTYSLGTPTSDYPDFQSALNDLYAQGVSGPTTFEIESGQYWETIFIDGEIQFIGGFYPIVFTSQTGNATDVVINAEDQYNLVFFEQTLMTFRNVTLKSDGNASYNVWFQETDACGLIDCILYSDAATTRAINSANAYTVIVEGCSLIGDGNAQTAVWDQNCSECEWTLNDITGYNTYGMRMVGTYGSDISRTTIDGNNVAWAGISMLATDNVAINNNTIENHTQQGITLRDDRYTGIYGCTISSSATEGFGYTGILSHQPLGRVQIGNNMINCGHSAFNRGIDLLSSGLRQGIEVLVYNNMVSVGAGTSTNYGLSIRQQMAEVNVFNNAFNVRSDNNASLSSALFTDVIETADPNAFLDVRNNIFSNFGGGYTSYANVAINDYRSDLNDLYTNGSGFAYYTADAANLDALYNLSGNDRNSISVDPLYDAEDDLHVNEPFLHIGNLASGIASDIDGDPRGDAQVTLGADELYPGFEIDAGFEKTVYLGYAPLECTNLTAIPTGGTAPYTYTWSNGATGATTNVCPSETRKYYVKGIDANGEFAVGIVTVKTVDVTCGTHNDKVELCMGGNDLCVPEAAATALLNQGATLGSCGSATRESGIEEAATSSLSAFPNPFSNEVTVSIPVEGAGTLKVFSATGQLVHAETVKNGATAVTIPTETWSAGVYVIQFNNATVKLVK